MIVDRIENAEQYYGIGEAVREALLFLKEHSEETQPVKLTHDATVKILPYVTLPDEKRKWEAHDHLIDIHYVAQGTEDICWANRNELKFLRREEGKDVLRFEGEGIRMTLSAGMFAIMFPQDAHKTKLAGPDGCETVLKGIVKISC